LRYNDFFAVVLDRHCQVKPRPRLIVVFKNRQQEQEVSDVQNVLFFMALKKDNTARK
jgi:hypothetical protein